MSGIDYVLLMFAEAITEHRVDHEGAFRMRLQIFNALRESNTNCLTWQINGVNNINTGSK